MRHPLVLVGLVIASPLLVSCDGDLTIPVVTPSVSMRDQCDSVSFNAALGAGTCKKNGTVTFSQFNTELQAQHTVSTWQFNPVVFTAQVGQSIVVTNNGGEVHTFTEVENFGGGIVPSLNTASGNPTEAPECAALTAEDFIQAGASHTDSPEDSPGTEKYQCCIHPWMRATVTVTAR
jgi:plastocyanin